MATSFTDSLLHHLESIGAKLGKDSIIILADNRTVKFQNALTDVAYNTQEISERATKCNRRGSRPLNFHEPFPLENIFDEKHANAPTHHREYLIPETPGNGYYYIISIAPGSPLPLAHA